MALSVVFGSVSLATPVPISINFLSCFGSSIAISTIGSGFGIINRIVSFLPFS
jgi:hypothetical protein